jgi:hypothetical protein
MDLRATPASPAPIAEERAQGRRRAQNEAQQTPEQTQHHHGGEDGGAQNHQRGFDAPAQPGDDDVAGTIGQ